LSGRNSHNRHSRDDDTGDQIPAVAYVRMSTDHQKYSTENQLDVIRSYATARGLTILRVFEDSGRSGLRLDDREALQALMAEVQSGRADFRAILVYDVSRWGRFQDADEGAYHEHVCSRVGIRVHYCGEQFENDGSIGSNLLKTVKRVMAGEYSRELSVKVFAGQCRLVELGYRQGGAAGYGLRRVLIDENGNPKGELSRGEQKSIQTDRVILVPGPADEQRVVQRMYTMFVDEGRLEREIAQTLNAEGCGLFGPVLVTVAIIIIWFLPTIPRPQDALAPHRLPAVLGPDLLGHLLTGFFIALPFWAGGDAGFSRSGIHVMAIITWPMAIGGIMLVVVAAGNASRWVRIEDNALEVATAWRRQRIRYADIARIEPWRRGLPRVLRVLVPLLAAGGHLTAAGGLMLTRDSTGVCLKLTDGRSIVIQREAFEKPLRRLLHVLKKKGVPMAAEGEKI